MVDTSPRAVNRFYKKHKANTNTSDRDEIFCHDENGHVVAAAIIRIIQDSPECHFKLFRSLLVAPDYRNQGIAKRIIAQATQNQCEPLYTICSEELVRLYHDCRFQLCETPPQAIAKLRTKKPNRYD